MSDKAAANEPEAVGSDTKRHWPTAATLIAAATALGGVLLHLIGATANQTYFKQWGLDSAMFPKPTDLTIALGYYALWDGLASAVLEAIRQHWAALLVYGLLVGACVVAALVFDKMPQRTLRGWIVGRERLLAFVFTLVVSVAVVALVIPLLLLSVIMVLALPISAGDSYGKKLVSEQLADFRLGCENPASHAKCTALLRAGGVVAKGFLIGSTETYVAIYEPVTNRTMLMERAGLTLRGAPNWLAYPPDWKASDIK